MILHFVDTPRLGSRLIRAFDSAPASHVGVESTLLPGVIVDSTWSHGGVRAWSKAEWHSLDDRRPILSFDIPLVDESAANAFAQAQLHKGYDYSAIFGIALLRDWQDDARWYCSELAIAACMAGGRTMATRRSEIGLRLAVELAQAWCHTAHDWRTATTRANPPNPQNPAA